MRVGISKRFGLVLLLEIKEKKHFPGGEIVFFPP